jgi:hypothetical protein
MTMLRSILVALGGAACLFAFAALGDVPGGAVTRAVAGVALGVAATTLVYGDATFAVVALGAVSPLVFAALTDASLIAASAAMCLLWLAPRFVLANTRRQLAIQAAVSLVAAAIAGSIFAAYWEAPLAAHAASCVFAGSCLSLVGVVVQVPTSTAYALRAAAAAIDGPVKETLRRAAQVHESARWQPRGRATRQKWRRMVRSSDRRAGLEGATGGGAAEQRGRLDEDIEDMARDLAPLPEDATVRPQETPPEVAAASDGDLAIRREASSASEEETRTAALTEV